VTKWLIVNADDFNLTEGVTRGILDGHRQGIITSATVMVNLPGLGHSRELAKGVSGLGLGLHVNLTWGEPISPAGAVPSLVDGTGCFIRDRSRVGESGAALEIRAEIAAQARRFVEVFGRHPTHLDTHYHMHRLPRILAAVLDVAGELGVPVRALSPEMAALIRGRGLLAADCLVGSVGPAAYWTTEQLRGCIRSLEEGITELSCHPGYADDALAFSSYTTQREVELHALCDPEVRAALAASDVQLIHYGMRAAPSLGAI
jgi:chitin disaccharide deacetylase